MATTGVTSESESRPAAAVNARGVARLVLMAIILGASASLSGPALAQSIPEATLIVAAQSTADRLSMPLAGNPIVTQRVMGPQLPAWEVAYPDVAYFWLDAQGTVRALTNDTASHAPPSTFSQPPLPEAEAIRLATQALTIVGAPPNLARVSAQIEVSGETEREWVVTWLPTYLGWPYEETTSVIVRLDAATGTLTGLRAWPPPPPPSIVVAKVSEEAATRIALDHAASLGETLAAPVTSARLEIAQPCLYWSSAVLGRALQGVRYDDPTRLIWRVELAEQTSEDLVAQGYPATRAVAYVQIDATTGAVVGDARAGGTFANPHPKPAASSTPSAPPRAKQREPLLRGIEGPLLLSLLSLFALVVW